MPAYPQGMNIRRTCIVRIGEFLTITIAIAAIAESLMGSVLLLLERFVPVLAELFFAEPPLQRSCHQSFGVSVLVRELLLIPIERDCSCGTDVDADGDSTGVSATEVLSDVCSCAVKSDMRRRKKRSG